MSLIFKKKKKQYCPYCLPIKASHHHYGEKLNYLVNRLLSPLNFLSPLLYSMPLERMLEAIEQWMMCFLVRIGALQLDTYVPEEKISNRTLIFFKEAKSRGIAIFFVCFLKRPTQYLAFIHKGRHVFYRAIPLAEEKDAPIDVDDKFAVKRFLAKNGLPVPEGSLFRSRFKAFRYGKLLGYPLVVKPNFSSLSRHVTCNISNDGRLKEAINIAKKLQPEFIIERYIHGSLFRVAVINYSHVFICEKEPAHVIGNGVSTIKELVAKKNDDPKRGDTNKKNTTLHKIIINEKTDQMLENLGYTLDTIPANGETVFLHDKSILSAGCDVIDRTSVAHPENKEMFLSVAKALNRKIVGIDFICEDISRSYREQSVAIIETNSLPYLDMHQFPSEGEAQPIAKIVWDEFLKVIQ
jgi:cyanophycin synthetase